MDGCRAAGDHRPAGVSGDAVGPIPTRILGKTGVQVTQLGLGGEGILRTYGYSQQAVAVIHKALDLGINYFDSARAYSGSEGYYGEALGSRRAEIFLTSKAFERSRAGAHAQLLETLKQQRTDYVDLWQVHDLRTEEDLAAISAPGGALEAFDAAKQAGLCRFVGVTGHYDPAIIRKAFDLYDFDTVLSPINIFDPHYLPFVDMVLPEARRRNMGIIAMKVYMGGQIFQWSPGAPRAPMLRFALSQPISTAIIGCHTPDQVEENARIAAEFTPMTEAETAEVLAWTRPAALNASYYKKGTY